MGKVWKSKYDYVVYRDNSPKEFKRTCQLIEKSIPGYRKRELVVDVDGSTLQVYEINGKKIVVYDDYDIGTVYIRSDIQLAFIQVP